MATAGRSWLRATLLSNITFLNVNSTLLIIRVDKRDSYLKFQVVLDMTVKIKVKSKDVLQVVLQKAKTVVHVTFLSKSPHPENWLSRIILAGLVYILTVNCLKSSCTDSERIRTMKSHWFYIRPRTPFPQVSSNSATKCVLLF